MAACPVFHEMGRNEFRRPCPTDLIQLAASHATVNHYLRYWQRGDINWEQMLLSLAIELAHRDVERDRAFNRAMMTCHPPSVVMPPKSQSYLPDAVAACLAAELTKPAAGQCPYGECDGSGTYKGLFKTETCRCAAKSITP